MPEESRDDGGLSAQRVAENEARVRNANERIEATAKRLQPSLTLIPFICECGRPECVVTLRLALADYEGVRKDARWFICSPGHELTQAGHERVIETRDGYVIVEKQDRAADVAERLNPRGETSRGSGSR